jgi:hypothetical protein
MTIYRSRTKPDLAKKYLMGADVKSDWKSSPCQISVSSIARQRYAAHAFIDELLQASREKRAYDCEHATSLTRQYPHTEDAPDAWRGQQ